MGIDRIYLLSLGELEEFGENCGGLVYVYIYYIISRYLEKAGSSEPRTFRFLHLMSRGSLGYLAPTLPQIRESSDSLLVDHIVSYLFDHVLL